MDEADAQGTGEAQPVCSVTGETYVLERSTINTAREIGPATQESPSAHRGEEFRRFTFVPVGQWSCSILGSTSRARKRRAALLLGFRAGRKNDDHR